MRSLISTSENDEIYVSSGEKIPLILRAFLKLFFAHTKWTERVQMNSLEVRLPTDMFCLIHMMFKKEFLTFPTPISKKKLNSAFS